MSSSASTNDLGYFDLQVNGYAGVDFNSDDTNTDKFALACRSLKKDGVDGILATVITDDLDAMCRRLQSICRAREADSATRSMIRGIHIEGPFINGQPGFVGAHPAKSVRPADTESMKRLFDAAEGLAQVVTLAPERDPGSAVTRMLVDQNVVVSAGHFNA